VKKEKLILIDGNALLYRAFYALPPLSTKEGIPTGGVYGFTRILLKLFREERPDYLACAFDKGKKTFRHQKWEEYKATRPKTPDELVEQIPLTKEVLKGFGVPIFEDEEYEADDILATLAKEGEKKGLHIDIFTGDKDILQIVSSRINIIRFKKGITQTEKFDPQKVKEEYGVSPEQIADYLALVGDVSDNIPGIPGIGPKAARRLIKEFGNLEEILANLDKLSPKLAQKIKENLEQVKLSKKLATIVTNVPLKFNLDELKVKNPNEKILLPVFQQLEFKGLIKDLSSSFKSSNPGLKQYKIKEREKNIKINSPEHFDRIVDEFFKAPLIIQLQVKEENLFPDFKIWELAFSSLKDEVIFQIELKERPRESILFKKFTKILSSEKIKKIGHNLKDTILIFKKWGIDFKGAFFDTSIAAYLLNPSSVGYSLSELYSLYLGKFSGDINSASQKIEIIRELYPVLQEQIKTQGMENLFFQIEMPLVEVLADMQYRGIKVESKILENFLIEVEEKRKKIREEIYEDIGERFNINSSQQLGQILFEKLNLPVVKRTKTGYSTDEEVIRALSALRPSLTKILEYRYLSKLESTYIRPLLNMIDPTTGRIHTQFSQITASTGRLASSHPNLQNIPIKEELGQKLRKAFVAEDGYLFISADYSQIELRILAHLSQDKNLISSFLKGEDIHRQTAAEIFDCLPLQVTPQMRRKAKVVNFGIVYGISPFGLSRDLGIPEKEAEEYIKKYFSRYPKVKEYIDKTLKEAEKRGYVTTMMGRRRYLPQIISKDRRQRELARRTAINSPIQGGAADLIKLAMINLHRRLKKEALPAWVVLQIHDELLLEVSEEVVDQVKKIVKEEMEGAMKLSVPLVVDTKVGKNWAEMKD